MNDRTVHYTSSVQCMNGYACICNGTYCSIWGVHTERHKSISLCTGAGWRWARARPTNDLKPGKKFNSLSLHVVQIPLKRWIGVSKQYLYAWNRLGLEIGKLNVKIFKCTNKIQLLCSNFERVPSQTSRKSWRRYRVLSAGESSNEWLDPRRRLLAGWNQPRNSCGSRFRQSTLGQSCTPNSRLQIQRADRTAHLHSSPEWIRWSPGAKRSPRPSEPFRAAPRRSSLCKMTCLHAPRPHGACRIAIV